MRYVLWMTLAGCFRTEGFPLPPPPTVHCVGEVVVSLDDEAVPAWTSGDLTVAESRDRIEGTYTTTLTWDESQEQTVLSIQLTIDDVFERSWTEVFEDSVCPYHVLYDATLTLHSADGRLDEVFEVQAEGERAGWARVELEEEASTWGGSLEAAPTETVVLVVSMVDGVTHGEIATLEQGDLGRW